MSSSISRRGFLKSASAAIVAPLIVPRLSFAASPSGKLQHAAIGVGGQGEYDLACIFSSGKVEVCALCDIDENNLKAAAKVHPGARLYRDWREMFEKEGDLDSVNVSTPDHMHALPAMAAIQRKLHTFCEKPLTHNVYEARQLTLAARKKGVASQMGIQIHSHDFYRMAVQWLQEGAIGKIKEWHSWSAAVYTMKDKNRPAGEDPVPPAVEWDLWLGGAPARPFKTGLYHPFKWRCWRDFGGGATGDFGCHIFDPVFTALGIGAPLAIASDSECVSDEVFPAWSMARYLFDGTPLTTGKTIEATWMDGGKKPDKGLSPHLPKKFKMPPSGSMLIGEDGTMIIPHVGEPSLYPEEKFKDYPKPKLEPKDHYHEFVEAALGNGKPGANFDFAGPLTEAVLLGNIANRFPKKSLTWDAKKLKFANCDEANAYLRQSYRDGWDEKGL